MSPKEIAAALMFVSSTVFCSSGALISWALGYPFLNARRRRQMINFWCFTLWGKFVKFSSAKFLGMKIVVQNKEEFAKIPGNGNFLVLADHRGWADVAVILSLFDKWYPRSVVKKAVGDTPFFGWVCRVAGHVIIPRSQEAKQNWITTVLTPFLERNKTIRWMGTRKNGSVRTGSVETIRSIADLADISAAEGVPYCYFIFPTGTRWAPHKARSPDEVVLPAKSGITTTLLQHFHGQLQGIVFVNVGYKGPSDKLVTRRDVRPYLRGEIASCEVTLKWVPIKEVPDPQSHNPETYYREVKTWLNEEWEGVTERYRQWLESHNFSGDP